MVKRSATEAHIGDRSSFFKAPKDVVKREDTENDGMGEYEDPWEDEIEPDEDGGEDEDKKDEAMDVDPISVLEDSENEEEEESTKPFILGIDKLAEDDILEADDSAYIMRHELSLGWSCLSLDILRDNLGDERQRLPTSACVITGSQADRAEDNYVSVVKLSPLHRTQTHDSEDSEDEDEDVLDEDPIVERRSIPHMGTVNRVRAQRLATPILPPVSQPYYAATFSDTGKVYIYNIRPLIESLDVPGYALDKNSIQTPSFTVNSHTTEGYAMDWNAPAASSLGLLTGDNDSNIYITTASNADFRPSPIPFQSHTSSVEDLQWSPTEITVFASCSVDRSIRIWDVRAKARQSVASIIDAHDSDVNVVSWNRLTAYLLLSGDDEGGLKVWDLRNIQKKQAQVARFDWHKGPITSVEWHPTEDSVFAASSDDNQVTLWDLAVEQDDDFAVKANEGSAYSETSNIANLPPQLLFTHHHEHVKDVHWHPQIPGVLISTGISTLNVFKTINM